jgi:hypothetical protein
MVFTPLIDCITTSCHHRNYLKRPIIISSRSLQLLAPLYDYSTVCVYRKELYLHGRMMQIKMAENGAFSSQKTRIVLKLIKCGYTLYDYSPIFSSLTSPNANDWQMLAAIGETFDPTLAHADSSTQSLITGVIVSTRPQFYRLSIWTRLAPSSPEDDRLRDRIEGVGKHFKMSVLGYSEGQKLAGPLATEVEFLSHKDSEKKGKSARKIIV